MALRSVDGGIRHVRIAVHRRLRARLRRHHGAQSPPVVPRRRPGTHLRLGSVAALRGVAGVVGHAIRHRRRRGSVMLLHVLVGRLSLEVRRHHLGVHGVPLRRAVLDGLGLVLAAIEVYGTLVLVRAAVLEKVSETMSWMTRAAKTYVGIARDELAHVRRGVLIEFLVVAKYKDGHVHRAEHGKLVSLLEEAALALQERTWKDCQSRGSAQRDVRVGRLTPSDSGHP